MLTKDLLRFRIEAGQIRPAFLDTASPRYRQAAGELIRIFDKHAGGTEGQLEKAIENYTLCRSDYRVLRGLARVLMSYVELETTRSDAVSIRTPVFEAAARSWPVVREKKSPLENDRRTVLESAAAEAGISFAQLEENLYSDLPERRRLARFNAPREPAALLARYNMELARGLLYWAERLTIEIGDSYQDVFRYIKLCRLMHTITRTDHGYRIELDGPLSLLRGTRRYGIKMAVFLPALALCRKWRMEAVIARRGERLLFSLDDESSLISHFRRFPLYDSRLEREFAAEFETSFARHAQNWRLARADAVIPLERNEVMIPDFTLRHSSGREVHLEIVGFWTPEYLQRKMAKLLAAGLGNLIVAVSRQLALGEAEAKELDVLWFTRKLSAANVIARADSFRVNELLA